ncbi:MAG TPA: MFS transporter [Euzebyales bacterium]
MTTAERPPGVRHEISRVTRAFLICHGLRWLPIGFALPILVLIATERGLDLPTVGIVFATYGVTTALLELPTGGLADAVGRRPVLLVATVADAALLAALAFGTQPWHFVLGAFGGGVGRALLTGPLESWYVDAVRAIEPTVALRRGLAAAGLVEGVAIASGAAASAVLPTVGADLPVDGPVSQLTLPIYGALIAEVVSFAAVLVLVREPTRARAGRWTTTARSVPEVVNDGIRLATGSHDLRLLIAVFVTAAIAYVGVEVLWQPRFATLLGGTSRATQTFGYVVVAMSLGAGVGAWLADRLPGSLAHKPARVGSLALAGAAGAMVMLASADTFAVAVAAFVAVYTTGAMRSVVEAELLHDRVPSSHRATMVSVQSLSEQLGNVIAGLTLTRVAAAAGIPAAWLIGAGLLVLAAVLVLAIRER